MIRLMVEPHQVEIIASDPGHNGSDADKPPEFLILDLPFPTKWCVDFEPCEFSEPAGKYDSSSDGQACGTYVQFQFKRPIFFKGYAFKLGNDCPERDPMFWKVIVKDCDGKKHRCTDDHYHVERFDAQHIQ
eukprot:CAMPEP_0168608522 /NCGR_PEP_ID=MMETSP0449_2-20121227/672_1 /TAXON_ID=1082188 /ORGANISM="Strombidium rassoulzadegani, Strain ras09" /LENGTH=130 /DNA_ID=CAMNT_0008648513 /DNA_START=82 /DNA_END=474 /DNA_ORIENTATION=+